MIRRRPILSLLVVLGLLEIVYLVAAYAFLKKEIFDGIVNRKPQKTFIDYKSAWTIFPGLVHVRGFLIRGQDRNVQWQFTLRDSVASFNLFSLPFRKVDIQHLTGSGATFHMRLRSQLKKRKRAVPEMAGLDPDFDLGPRTDPRKKWQVEISNINLDQIDEIWIENYKFTGDIKAFGSFYLWPGKEFQLSPSLFQIVNGQLNSGDKTLVDQVQGSLGGKVVDYFPEPGKGIEFLNSLTAKAELAGELNEGDVLNLYLRAVPWLKISEVRGHFNAAVSLEKGHIQPGSRLDIQSSPLSADFVDYRAQGKGTLVWQAVRKENPEAKETHVLLSMKLEDVFVRERIKKDEVMASPRIEVSAVSRDDEIIRLFKDLSVAIKIEKSSLPDFRFLNEFIPTYSDVRILSGHGELAADVEFTTHSPARPGYVMVDAQDLKIEYKKAKIRGRLKIETQIQDVDQGTDVFSLKGTKWTLDRVAVEPVISPDESEFWSGSLFVSDGTLTPRADIAFDGQLYIEMSDLSPIVNVYSMQRDIPPWLRSILDLRSITGYGSFKLGKKYSYLDQIRIATDKLGFQGRLLVNSQGKRGIALIDTRLMDIGIEINNESLRYQLTGAKRWFSEYPPFESVHK